MTDTSVVFNILAKDNASGVMGKIGGAAKGLMAAFAIGVGVDQIKDAIGAASDLAETQSKVNVIFGSGSAALDAWASHADTAMGQSKQQALDAAATFGTFARSAGLSGGSAVNFSTQMTTLASDMASFSNTTPQEAIEAIGAALRGEMEPIRKYGVLLDDASMRQQALKMGLIKTTTQALTPQQKVLAAQALILQQTTAAQGDFSRTSTGLANQQRIMAAEFENVKTKVGSALLPVMTKLMGVLVGTLGFVQRNSSWLTPLAIGLGIMAGAIWLVTAAQTAWNVAMMLNPIGLVIIAVVALVGAFVYLWTHSKAFRDFWIGLWNDIWGFLKGVGHWFANDFAGFFVDAYHTIMHGIDEAGQWIRGKFDAVVGFVTGIPGKLASIGSGMWNFIKDSFKSAVNWLISKWNGLHFGIPPISIPGVGQVFGGFNLTVPQIPYLAAGGTAVRGGLAVVGEHGAEVVSLPAGASVHPHGTMPAGGPSTMRIAGNTDGAFATALKYLIRTGQITFTDSAGQVVTVS